MLSYQINIEDVDKKYRRLLGNHQFGTAAYSHLVSYFQANLDNIKCYIFDYDNHMDDFEAYTKEEIQNFVIPDDSEMSQDHITPTGTSN